MQSTEKNFIVKTSVDYKLMSAKYDEVLTQLGRLKIFSLTTDVTNLEHDLSITQKCASESKAEVDNLAQYLRRDCVEIIGLKPTKETTCART